MARPLAVSLGDPAGIGPEIVAKAWEARATRSLSSFFAVGDPRSIARIWSGPIAVIDNPGAAPMVFDRALPVLVVENAGEVVPGCPDIEGARCALASLELALSLTRAGAAAALVTGPVSKAQLYAVGFNHPGQTEFVADRCGVAPAEAVMMLAGPGLRVVPMTTHVPLAEVPLLLTQELIVTKTQATIRGLRELFGVDRPRLALAGLNPHAGENGALGREEIEVMAPALALLQAEGVDIAGPLAADTMFNPRARARYDAALCAYHDQALVPIKTLFFDDGVNLTLGLPIIRTSPDHGTAFALAGRNEAEPGAMIAAIAMAAETAARRAVASAA